MHLRQKEYFSPSKGKFVVVVVDDDDDDDDGSTPCSLLIVDHLSSTICR